MVSGERPVEANDGKSVARVWCVSVIEDCGRDWFFTLKALPVRIWVFDVAQRTRVWSRPRDCADGA